MNDKEKRQLEQEIIEGDQDWELYLQGIEAESLGLTLEQYQTYQGLTSKVAEEYLLEHSTVL